MQQTLFGRVSPKPQLLPMLDARTLSLFWSMRPGLMMVMAPLHFTHFIFYSRDQPGM